MNVKPESFIFVNDFHIGLFDKIMIIVSLFLQFLLFQRSNDRRLVLSLCKHQFPSLCTRALMTFFCHLYLKQTLTEASSP